MRESPSGVLWKVTSELKRPKIKRIRPRGNTQCPLRFVPMPAMDPGDNKVEGIQAIGSATA